VVLEEPGDGHVREHAGEVLAETFVGPAAEAVQVPGLAGLVR